MNTEILKLVVVLGVGILSSLVTYFLKPLIESKFREITIETSSGRKLEIPSDMSESEIKEFIERLSKLNEPDQSTDRPTTKDQNAI